MLLWEFILTADNARELSDGGRALAWLVDTDYLAHFTLGRGGERCSPPSGCWTAAHTEFFQEQLLALRSLGPRLKGFRSREPRAEPLAADTRLRHYVRYMTFRVAQKGRAGAGGSPPVALDRRNFDGLKLMTEIPSDAEEWPVGGWDELNADQQFVLRELDKFFASAFVSMVSEGIEPICGRCGKPLELTPKGRKPRAKFCKACAFKAWQDTQTQEQKRKRWRQDKQQQRAENE